jgi:hypothetical protein
VIPVPEPFKVALQHLDDEMHEWLLDQPHGMLTSHLTCSCDWCDHDWHSAGCGLCRCDNARRRRDDTWRPTVRYQQVDQIRSVCDDTGVDGWAARTAVGIARAGIPDPARMKKLLYGKGSD